jgi:hypothetical protein
MLLLGCGTDPRDIVITEENGNDLLAAVNDQEGLTVEEIGLLSGYQIRRELAEAFNADTETVAGRTIGSLIEEQRSFQAEQQAKQAEEERMAAEARARAQALADELKESIALVVYGKSFRPANIDAGRFEESIIIRTTYENKSAKDIRAFRGRIRFTARKFLAQGSPFRNRSLRETRESGMGRLITISSSTLTSY